MFIFLFKYLTTAVCANKIIIIIIINQWENHARAATPGLMAISGCLISLPCVYLSLKIVYKYFKHTSQVTKRCTGLLVIFGGLIITKTTHVVIASFRHIGSLVTGARLHSTFATEEIHHYKQITISVAWKSLLYIIV